MVAPESASEASAVMPTTSPMAAFSATELASVLLSLRTTRLSLTLVTVMATARAVEVSEPSDALTVMS